MHDLASLRMHGLDGQASQVFGVTSDGSRGLHCNARVGAPMQSNCPHPIEPTTAGQVAIQPPTQRTPSMAGGGQRTPGADCYGLMP